MGSRFGDLKYFKVYKMNIQLAIRITTCMFMNCRMKKKETKAEENNRKLEIKVKIKRKIKGKKKMATKM